MQDGRWMLQARGLALVYGGTREMVRAFDGSDLLQAPGSASPDSQRRPVVRAGCGKSTLLHLLGGLERPSDGQVWLAGQRIDTLSERALARMRRTSIGFVFQAFHLMEELSAAQNVEVPALLAGSGPRAARRRAAGLLQRVGLADQARHLPSALSGGQRQRLAIARALSNQPLVVLADEPTGNLDSAATRQVLRLFADVRSAGQTVVLVTHDNRVAGTADRVIMMRDRMLTGGRDTA